MIFKDYYKILGLEDNHATKEEIKSAFREQAKKYHPDVNISDNIAEEKFKDINEAYKTLEKPASRRKYDRMWNTYVGRKKQKQETKKDEMFSDIFSVFWGLKKEENNTQEKSRKKTPIRGEDIDTEISVGIEEAFYGASKKISLRAVNGKMKTFSVKIPEGIRNYEKIRLSGQGKEGENGGDPGDLLIKIHIEDSKLYRLIGYDVHTDLMLTPWEAALGTKVPINTIDEEVTIYVPQGIESGEKIRIPQKGYKDGKGGRGDLVAEIKIMVPKNISEQERKLFEELKEISKFKPRVQYL